MTIDPNDQAMVDGAVAAANAFVAACQPIDAALGGGRAGSSASAIQLIGDPRSIGQAAQGILVRLTKVRLSASGLAKLSDDERMALLGY